MNNPDRAVELAQFLHEAQGMSATEMQAETVRRWPDLTQDELQRGVKIAMELLQSDTAEHQAEAEAIRAELARRGLDR
jgi:hypothetical protein